MKQFYSSEDTSVTKNDKYICFSCFFLVRYSTITVLWLGQIHSSLRSALIEYLMPIDINIICFSTEEQLWYWLNTNCTMKVTSLVIETNSNTQNIFVAQSNI